jgi:hypothetical protein
MSSPNILLNYAAGVQAQMRKKFIQLKQQRTPTLNSFKSGAGTRSEDGRIVGLEIPFNRGVQHGETALDVLSGITSFENFVAPAADKMFVGLTQTGFSIEYEKFQELDASRGLLPETKLTQRDKTMRTYAQHHNWYRIGPDNSGSLAIVTVGGGSGTITLANDNTTRGRSKGSLRLAVSNSTAAGQTIIYESWTRATDTKTATFYLTSKASVTTAVIVVTDAGTVVAGDVIVKKGHYKRVPYSLGYHISTANRSYQGANTTTDTMFNSFGVDCGGALVTPTAMDTAKGALQTRKNQVEAGKQGKCYLTIANYKQLAAYGYNLRVYNAEQGDAKTTYAVPTNFKDEDIEYIQDADMEDYYIYMTDRSSYFEYRQSEMFEVTSNAGSQYIGTNSIGSTEFFQNWGESYNFAWDARGDDGANKDGAGSPNSSVVLSNMITGPATQILMGQSLV